MKLSCELCKSAARIYCESDQASLCWTCDSKVHSANFLVARHSRALLCRVCQSVTPWTACGQKLGPSAVSVCDNCVAGHSASDDDDEEEDDDDGLLQDQPINNDEEEGENQVVPLLLCSTPPPPVASSSSSSSDGGCGDEDLCVSDTNNCFVSVKRKRSVNVVDISSSQDGIENRKKAMLYQFLPTSSEEMAEKLARKKDHRSDKSSKDKDGMCKGMTTVGLDLNAD
uniref:uncharacterized protein LOC122578692 n=1 Tax=Erigeron canadensis TaxID=72917 RepID=UPI001CB97821|nr:uncharacterized protein LOC122578692 [Erigeron canadensis]